MLPEPLRTTGVGPRRPSGQPALPAAVRLEVAAVSEPDTHIRRAALARAGRLGARHRDRRDRLRWCEAVHRRVRDPPARLHRNAGAGGCWDRGRAPDIGEGLRDLRTVRERDDDGPRAAPSRSQTGMVQVTSTMVASGCRAPARSICSWQAPPFICPQLPPPWNPVRDPRARQHARSRRPRLPPRASGPTALAAIRQAGRTITSRGNRVRQLDEAPRRVKVDEVLDPDARLALEVDPGLHGEDRGAGQRRLGRGAARGAAPRASPGRSRGPGRGRRPATRPSRVDDAAGEGIAAPGRAGPCAAATARLQLVDHAPAVIAARARRHAGHAPPARRRTASVSCRSGSPRPGAPKSNSRTAPSSTGRSPGDAVRERGLRARPGRRRRRRAPPRRRSGSATRGGGRGRARSRRRGSRAAAPPAHGRRLRRRPRCARSRRRS